MTQPESRIVRRIVSYLNGLGAWTFKVHGGDSPFQETGVPDVLFCLYGRFGAFEVKQPGETPSAKQLHTIHLIKEAGGVASVVESVEQAERLIERKFARLGG